MAFRSRLFLESVLKHVVEPEVRSIRCQLYNGRDRGDCQEYSGRVEGAELIQESLERLVAVLKRVEEMEVDPREDPHGPMAHYFKKLPPEILSHLKHVGRRPDELLPDDPDSD